MINSVSDMGQNIRDEKVDGIRIREISKPDVKDIREQTGLSQTRFAYLIGVTQKPYKIRNSDVFVLLLLLELY